MNESRNDYMQRMSIRCACSRHFPDCDPMCSDCRHGIARAADEDRLSMYNLGEDNPITMEQMKERDKLNVDNE